VSAVREYLLTLLVATAVTYLLTPLVRRLAIRFKVVIPARDRDVHAAPIPRMGGLAMFAGVAAGLLVASRLVWLRRTFYESGFHGDGLVLGLLGAGGLIVIVGIVDDRWGIGAIGKLAGQVVAAGILFASGAQLWSFPEPNNHLFSLTQNESVVLTILVVVATINAVNFIDGLDGLAAGIVFIAAISFFAYYYSLTKVVHLSAEAVPALAAILLAGACLGFLPHNFHPARIFMGDTGSMLLGLLLAYVPISAINSLDYTSLNYKANRYAEILPLLLPAAVMVIPYVDMLRAVIRRTRAGQSPFAADRKHLHHTMLEIGHSHRSSVLILYAWAALFSAAVVGLSIATVSLAVLVWITLAAVLALALLSIPKLRWWERNRPELAARGSRMPAATQPGATQPGDQTAPVPVLASRPTFLAESAPPGQWPAEAGADGNGAVRLPENGSSVRWPGDQADGDRAQFSARGQAAGESVPPFDPPAAAEPAAQPVARASGSIIP
jgi:UDP-GlcNAc:undecaprenyl-phosphate GlcNAc-1-phosphate transferase